MDTADAEQMLAIVRAAGVDAVLVALADMPPEAIPEGLELEGRRTAHSIADPVCCFMLVPEDEKERAEVAAHLFYGLCRWCGRRVKGQVTGTCPGCGTPINPFARQAE